MKLFFSPASPFARKVLVAAHESGTVSRIETELAAVTPVAPNADIGATNSLGKIPTLVLDDGTGLFDSRVICEYLCSLAGDTTLFPASGDARWQALRLQALGDGICDTAVGLRYELALRPEELRWGDWIEKQRDRLNRTFDQLEGELAGQAETVTIGSIAVACALAYIEFRMPDLDWRSGRPELTSWYDSISTRPSMMATAPEG